MCKRNLAIILVVCCHLGCGQLQNGGLGIYATTSVQSIGAAGTVISSKAYIRVQGNGAARTLGSPNVVAGIYPGQQCLFRGNSDANTLTFQDTSVNPNSTMEFTTAASIVLGANDILMVVWNGSKWTEVNSVSTLNADD
jgi:hypothetical protein